MTAASEAGATVGQTSQNELRQESDNESCKICKPSSLPRSPEQVRERILEGTERRRIAKRGTIKRLLGNAKAIAASVMLASCAAVGMAMQTIPQGSIVRPDLLEIVGGEAQVTEKFTRWGWYAARPVSLGSDDVVCDADGQRRLLEWVDRSQPRLVVLTCPHRIWCAFSSSSETSSQERRRSQKKRLQYKGFLGFVEKIFEKQIRRGDDALAESPVGNSSFKETAIQKLVDHPEVYTVVVPRSSKPESSLRSQPEPQSSSLWMSTSVEVCEEIALRCPASDGGPERGSRRVAAAICKGYVKTLRRKDPSRIRRLLRQVAARIRGSEHAELIRDLRWNEKNIAKALARWSAVFAVGSNPETPQPDAPMTGTLEDSGGEEEMIPDDVDLGGEHPLRSSLAHDGIRFEVPPGRKLNVEIREGLKKAHCNLGHPSKKDLQRFLRLGGAKQEVIEAVDWMRCLSCAHSSRPKTHRATSIPPCSVTFGDEVHLDCICVHDSGGESHWFLSIIDRATSYHIVELLRDHSPVELNKAFDRAWSKWAGPPLQVSVDFEGGFRGKEFWTKVSEAGSALVSIAGTAHWQAGKIERHNQTIKDMLRTVVRQTSPKGREQMRAVGREVAWSKNTLAREHGWAPVALVFGKEPRVFGELHREGEASAFHPRVGDPGSEVARRMQYRYHAKMEYIKSQARQMLARTAHDRVRKITNPRVGQMVFFWRSERKREPSRWVGPGYVVGLQGSNAWVAIGGRCFLVAGEHLREACGDEKHFGDPQIQKAIALFKKAPKEATFEDLTMQEDPVEEPLEVEQQSIMQELASTGGDRFEGVADLPSSLARLVDAQGWQRDDAGNPVIVSQKAWAYRTPEAKLDIGKYPFRTTWGKFDGAWQCLEKDVRWSDLDNPNGYLRHAPAELLITVFQSKTKREMCLEDVPVSMKKQKASDKETQRVHAVTYGKSLSKNKLKRMMDKEIPYEKIPEGERRLYQEAQEKEWNSWKQYDSCEILSEEESARVLRECPSRVLPSRYVYRNKNAGLVDEKGKPLPTRAKARLCLQGHLCPDAQTGQVQVDSPTVERVSTMLFLHMAVSYGWTKNWYIGDISNAFLQGAPLVGKQPMYMKPPKQGLAGVKPNQLLRLLKPVYGRPDAPRAWYEELARVLTGELGFCKSYIDPAVFMLRDHQGTLVGVMVVHVDDLMFCHDGSAMAVKTAETLAKRFPFGTWDRVADKPSGVTYCGKEIRLQSEAGRERILLSQDGFIDGRLEEMELSRERKRNPELYATEEERGNFRSVVGSLQWLTTQSRPDLAFETNQLQKRIADLRVGDLVRANKAVREAKLHRMQIVFEDLGRDSQLVVYSDAGLYSSVGVEISEQEADDVLQSSFDKRLVYSQKGAVVGFVKRGSTEIRGTPSHINILDWRSSTNKRVVESSFAAETHAALMALGMGHFCQVLTSELRYGSDVVGSIEDDGWNDLVQMTLVTDCKSIYDTVHKDGQHITDKASVVHAVLLRQMLSTRKAECKTWLLWVPTRHQIADGFTKGGRSKELREQVASGVVFRETAVKRSKPSDQQYSSSSVKVLV